MRKLMPLLLFLGVLAGCGSDTPDADDIKAGLLREYRQALQERVNDMVGLVGEERAREAIASSEGTADPSEVRITSFTAEGIRRLDNGDVTAKVAYTVAKGKKVRFEKQQRVTLTTLQGEWKVTKLEDL